MEAGTRVPRVLRIVRQSRISFLDASILAAVLLTWYHLDPSSRPTLARRGWPGRTTPHSGFTTRVGRRSLTNEYVAIPRVPIITASTSGSLTEPSAARSTTKVAGSHPGPTVLAGNDYVDGAEKMKPQASRGRAV